MTLAACSATTPALRQRNLGDEVPLTVQDPETGGGVHEARDDVAAGDQIDADEDLVGLREQFHPRGAVVRRIEWESHQATAWGALRDHRDVVVAVNEAVGTAGRPILEHLEPGVVGQPARQEDAPAEALARHRQPAAVRRHLRIPAGRDRPAAG